MNANTGNDSRTAMEAQNESTPWDTLQKAADNTASSDFVIVATGTYGTLTESSSGVTYVASGDVLVSSASVTLSGNNNRIFGATRSGCSWEVDMNYTGGVSASAFNLSGTGNQLWHVKAREFPNTAVEVTGAGNIVVGIDSFGNHGTVGTDANDSHTTVFTDDALIAYANQDTTGNDYNNFASDRPRFFNIRSRDPSTNTAGHPDQFQTGGHAAGGSFYWIDAPFYVDSGEVQDDHHWYNFEANGFGNHGMLIRYGITFRNGTGSGFFQEFNRIGIVHCSVIESQRWNGTDPATNTPYALVASGTTSNLFLINNLFFEAWGDNVTAPDAFLIDSGGLFVHEGSLAWDKQGGSPSWSEPLASETGAVFQNPLFTDYAATNFWLQGGSPAFGAARPIATVQSVSGSGTSFDVNLLRGCLFRGASSTLTMYGGNLGKGMKITVGTDQVQVDSVSADTVTTTTSFTWANGDAIYYGWNATQDIGALPNVTPLSSATYVLAGSTYTVSPNGATRWVVFFQDGVTHTVDETAPFTADIASGSVTIKAYAQYAQLTSVVNASAGLAGDVLYRNRGKATRSAGVIP